MTGRLLFAAVMAGFTCASALADGIGGTQPVTPHYSVQTPPVDADLLAAKAPAAQSAATTQPKPPDETVIVSGLRPAEDTTYRLGTGDKLRVTVFGEDDLSGQFEIDSQGFVRLPLIGQIQAAGLTTYGLEGRISEAMVTGGFLLTPKVNVEVTGYRPFYIIGEVAKPGEYPYVNAMTAENAVALAGGYTDRAVTSAIWVRHKGERKEHELAADDDTTRIQPGDVLRVEKTTYWALMTILSPLISPFSAIAYLLK
jgi:protein involved in polysaccharide export with SLBB domain